MPSADRLLVTAGAEQAAAERMHVQQQQATIVLFVVASLPPAARLPPSAATARRLPCTAWWPCGRGNDEGGLESAKPAAAACARQRHTTSCHTTGRVVALPALPPTCPALAANTPPFCGCLWQSRVPPLLRNPPWQRKGCGGGERTGRSRLRHGVQSGCVQAAAVQSDQGKPAGGRGAEQRAPACGCVLVGHQLAAGQARRDPLVPPPGRRWPSAPAFSDVMVQHKPTAALPPAVRRCSLNGKQAAGGDGGGGGHSVAAAPAGAQRRGRPVGRKSRGGSGSAPAE